MPARRLGGKPALGGTALASGAQVSDLVHQIYAAGAEPEQWPSAIGSVAQAMRGTQALLHTPYAVPDESGLLFAWRIPQDQLSAYSAKWRREDVWTLAAMKLGHIVDGNAVCDADLLPRRELMASPFYKAYLRPLGVGRLCLGVLFGGAPGLPATALSVYRAPNDPFNTAELALMSLLVPHVSRAAGLMHRLKQARGQHESLRAALNRLNLGVVLLNEHLQVIFTNSEADQVLARADGLSLNAKGGLSGRGADPSDRLNLDEWLARQTAAPVLARSDFSAQYVVARTPWPASYSVQWCPLEQSDPLAKAEGASHIVFVTDPQHVDLPSPQMLQSQLGLTAAQARVAYAMASSTATHAEIARALDVSTETVRSHVKSIYSKTHTANKASLKRLVLSLGSAAT